MVHEKKILKNKDIQNASLVCIFESISKNLILFCEILVLTLSDFALKVTLLNLQTSNYAGKLAYILFYPRTKLLMRQIRILIS